MKKITAIALCLILLISLSSCFGGGDEGSKTTQATTTAATTEFTYDNRLVICKDNKTDYIIVTSREDISKTAYELSSKLSIGVKNAFGVLIRSTTDLSATAEYEIVLGRTNRYTRLEKLDIHEYLFTVKNNSIIIVAGSDEALSGAVDAFIRDVAVPDPNGNFSVPKDMHIKGELNKAEIQSLIDARLEIESRTVTVATFNIKNGAMVDHDFDILAQDIIDSGADIVALQEVDMITKRNGYQDTMQALSEATGYDYYIFGKAMDFSGGEYGNAILSKYPIETSSRYPLPGDGEARSMLYAKIRIKDGCYLNLFNTHIQQSCTVTQFEYINSVISQHDSYILAGDFNNDPTSVFDVFANTYLANPKSNPLVTTQDGHRFDNLVITKSGIKYNNVRVFRTDDHTDHYMLLADVTVG